MANQRQFLCAASLAALCLVIGQGALSASRAAEVELKLVKFADLTKAVQAQKGKIVVIDVWGDFCVPCKKEFPHFVKLHQTYGKDGVVCISVSVDELDRKESALKFLKKENATFSNFILDEPADTWQDAWNFKGPPAVLIYDRNGKLDKNFNYDDPCKQYTHEDVEKAVRELLKK